MVRYSIRRRRAPRRNRERRMPGQRIRLSSRPSPVMSSKPLVNWTKLSRVIMSSLPLLISGKPISLSPIFDFAFDLISSVFDTRTYFQGAYAMFGVTPGALIFNSPLLAEDTSGKFSFPSHPVSIRYVRFTIRNTTKQSEHSGRWAAVYIPYREPHDADHYASKIDSLTFQEVVAMPHSVECPATTDITLKFRSRDRTDYCARPRELNEEIGVLLIIWDLSSKNLSVASRPFENSDFNCLVEMESGCVPHVIFGPKHRVLYDKDVFKVKTRTKGDAVLVHSYGPDGTRSSYRTDLASHLARIDLDDMAIE